MRHTMGASIALNIIFAILLIVLGFFSVYYKGSAKLQAFAAKYIKEAEETYKDTISGGQKFQIVMGKLYALIPAAFRPFIPESFLSAIVQNIFDQIDAYAKSQLDKAVGKLPEAGAATAK